MSEITTAQRVITLSTTIAAGATVSTGVGTPMIVGKDIALDGGSERVRTYTSSSAATAAAADLTAGEIDAITAAEIVAFAGANPRTTTIYVCKQDATSGGESVQDALNAAEAAGFYAPWQFTIVILTSRIVADHASFNTWRTADSDRYCLALMQSADGGWLTTGLPTSYAAWETSAMIYHDDSTDAVDGIYGGAMGGRNVLQRAVGDQSGRVSLFTGATPTVTAYGTPLTATELGFAVTNNCNFHLPATNATASRICQPGVMLDGTTWLVKYFEIVAYVTIYEAIASNWMGLVLRGEVLTTGIQGRNLIASWAVGDESSGIEALKAAGWVIADPANSLPDGYTVVVTNNTSTSALVTVTLAIGDAVLSISVPITIRPVGA